MDLKQAKQVRNVVNEVYQEMRKDEDFRDSSSALGMWEEEDHFLMFRQQRVLIQEITPWMQDQESVGQPTKNP